MKTYRKKAFMSIRLDAELYDMLRELMPLFGNDRTKTIEQCLYTFMYSEGHADMLEKLHRLRINLLECEEFYRSNKTTIPE